MDKPLRIGVFAGSFPVPSETFILNQVVQLKRRGHDVQVFGYRFKGLTVNHPAIKEPGLVQRIHHPWRIAPWSPMCAAVGLLDYATLPRRNPRIWSARDVGKYGWMAESWHLFYWACLIARSGAFDAVHAHFVRVGGICGMLQDVGLLDAPIVCSFHGIDVTAVQDETELKLAAFCREKSALYTYNTEFIAGKAAAMGFDRQRMRHLPVGLDMSFFPFSTRSTHEGPLNLLSVARLDEAKGIHIALQALALLREKGIRFSYKVIGEGPWRGQFESMVKSLGLTDCVELPGWKTQDEVLKAMRAADIFLLPSITGSDGRTEGQGLALQEAQATGLPVVATIHNGFPENITDAVTGFLVPESDVNALAAAIRRLAENPDLRANIASAARDYVESKFDSAKLVVRHEEILREAIATSKR